MSKRRIDAGQSRDEYKLMMLESNVATSRRWLELCTNNALAEQKRRGHVTVRTVRALEKAQCDLPRAEYALAQFKEYVGL